VASFYRRSSKNFAKVLLSALALSLLVPYSQFNAVHVHGGRAPASPDIQLSGEELREKCIVDEMARLGITHSQLSDPNYRRDHAYEILNADIAAQFEQPELKWILRDPDKFFAEIEQRFEAQKALTPKTPYQFDYSEFGMPLLKDMDAQLHTKIEQLRGMRQKIRWNKKGGQELDTMIAYLNDLSKEVDSRSASGKISYQDLYELSYFFSRATGHFDARAQNPIQKLYLWSDNYLAGYEQYSADKEYDLYKKRKFSVFTKEAKTGGFIRTADQFEQAFLDPDKLRMIIVPTNAALNRDIFMRLNHHHIYFIGVTDTPIGADGIDRPGGHFWNHDIRHSTVMYAKREAYFKSLNLTPEKEAELKRQMDIWYLDLLDRIKNIQDPKVRDAVIFLQFNYQHEKGFPLEPSAYKDPRANKDPYLLYSMMETNKQKTIFGPQYINYAYKWLKAFWDSKIPEQRAITGQ
jgi:hypothetical protein